MSYKEDLRGFEETIERPRQIVQSEEIIPIKSYTPNLKTDNEDFKTFEKFLQFNQLLNMTTQLQKDGVITFNQPFQSVQPTKDNVIEVELEEREKHTFSGVALAIFGVIMLGLALV